MLPEPPSSLLLSVVVPCHNEEGNVRQLFESIQSALAPLEVSYEIVVTDDGSTDGTWQIVKQCALADTRIRAQRFSRNFGQSAALWAGIKAARGRFIVTLDSDLQNDPQDLPAFLKALEKFDCVCGTRVAARRQGDNWVRIVSSRVANGVRNSLSGEQISDAGCTFRAFKRECVANLKFFKGMHRFLPTLIKMEGFTVTEIPISHHARGAGQTHYGISNRLFASFYDLLAVRWMKQRMFRYEIEEEVKKEN
jgi:dolichol-phosphate mannosyltransferase